MTAHQTPPVTVLRGDVIAMLKTLEPESIDGVVSSSPYFRKLWYENAPGQHGLEATLRQYLATQTYVFHELARVMKPGGVIYWNLGSKSNNYSPIRNQEQQKTRASGDWVDRPKSLKDYPEKEDLIVPFRLVELLRAMKRADDPAWVLRNVLIWDKGRARGPQKSDSPTPSHEYILQIIRWPNHSRCYGITEPLQTSVLRYAPVSHPDHPCPMPPDLAAELICTFPAGATLLDPYCGVGTVLEQARLAGHPSIGIDLNPVGFARDFLNHEPARTV